MIVLHCNLLMPEKPQGFLREQVNTKGLICLICIRCEKMVAYSDNPRALAIAEAAHAKHCPGPIFRSKPAKNNSGKK